MISTTSTEQPKFPTLFELCEQELLKSKNDLLDQTDLVRVLDFSQYLKPEITQLAGEECGIKIVPGRKYKLELYDSEKFHKVEKVAFERLLIWNSDLVNPSNVELSESDSHHLAKTAAFAQNHPSVTAFQFVLREVVNDKELLSTSPILTDVEKPTKVSFSNIKLGGYMTPFLKSLSSNGSLVKLNLNRSRVTLTVLKQLYDLLNEKNHPPIHSLNLSNNELWDEAASLIGRIILLKECPVVSLRLCNNRFTTSGTKEIFRSVITKSDFKKLDLSSNELDDEGKGMLAKLIAEHPSITKLALRRMGLKTTDIINYIINPLNERIHKGWLTVDLRMNTIDTETILVLRKMEESNRKIKFIL